MALTRRSKPKTAVDAPKPLPARGKEEEPETTLCKGVEPDVKSGPRTPIMGMCMGCGLHASNSESDHLCYNCHKEAEGFEFNTEKKIWTKIKGKK